MATGHRRLLLTLPLWLACTPATPTPPATTRTLPPMVLDRIEGEFAVLDTDDAPLTLPRSILPAQAREGDLVLLQVTVEQNTGGVEELQEYRELLDSPKKLSADR